MFSGLVFCNDCKQKLYYSTTSYFEKRQDFFICSTHRVNKDKCSGHYIRAVVLEQQVWNHIQEVISIVTRHEAYFCREMEHRLLIQSGEVIRVVKSLQAEIEKQEQQAENLELFIRRVHRSSQLTELTPYALRELVKAVYVEATDKSSGKRKQKIHICYDLIGCIPVDELTQAEQA